MIALPSGVGAASYGYANNSLRRVARLCFCRPCDFCHGRCGGWRGADRRFFAHRLLKGALRLKDEIHRKRTERVCLDLRLEEAIALDVLARESGRSKEEQARQLIMDMLAEDAGPQFRRGDE